MLKGDPTLLRSFKIIFGVVLNKKLEYLSIPELDNCFIDSILADSTSAWKVTEWTISPINCCKMHSTQIACGQSHSRFKIFLRQKREFVIGHLLVLVPCVEFLML